MVKNSAVSCWTNNNINNIIIIIEKTPFSGLEPTTKKPNPPPSQELSRHNKMPSYRIHTGQSTVYLVREVTLLFNYSPFSKTPPSTVLFPVKPMCLFHSCFNWGLRSAHAQQCSMTAASIIGRYSHLQGLHWPETLCSLCCASAITDRTIGQNLRLHLTRILRQQYPWGSKHSGQWSISTCRKIKATIIMWSTHMPSEPYTTNTDNNSDSVTQS